MVCLVRAAWKHSPLLFAALKVDFRLFGFPSSVVKLFVGFLQLFSGLVQLLHGPHVGRLDLGDGGLQLVDLLFQGLLHLFHVVVVRHVDQILIQARVVDLYLCLLLVNHVRWLPVATAVEKCQSKFWDISRPNLFPKTNI